MLIYAFAFAVAVWLVGSIRIAIARKRRGEQWLAQVRHEPDGSSLHIVQSPLRDGIRLLLLGDNRGRAIVGVWTSNVPGTLPEGPSHLAFRTDRKANISGPAEIVRVEDGLVVAYANGKTLPVLVRALANSNKTFEVWAKSPLWPGDKYLRLEGATMARPALRLIEDAEKAEMRFADLMNSEELFPSDPERRTIN